MATKKNTAKVAKARLKAPTATTREIENMVWVDHSTVSRIDKQLQQTATKDDRIVWICDTDMDIVLLAQAKIKGKIKKMDTSEQTEDIKARDLSAIARESAARYSIFMGDSTDNKGWARFPDLSIDQLVDQLNSINSKRKDKENHGVL